MQEREPSRSGGAGQDQFAAGERGFSLLVGGRQPKKSDVVKFQEPVPEARDPIS